MRRIISTLFSAELFFTALLLLSCSHALSASETPKPQSIVSINLCFDALLLKLVEPERINSLYYLSANPQFSPVAEQAKRFYLNRGLAEDIVPRNPDLILAGEYTSLELSVLLKQLGLRVELLSLPRTLDEVASHIRQFGQLTDTVFAAEKMAQEFEHSLVALDEMKKKSPPVPAYWYSSNGVVVGDDTLENELMMRAGFYNLALDKNIVGFKQLDLEELILSHPKVLIVESSDVQAFSLAQEYVQHPALRNHLQMVRLPTSLSCIAPVAAEAIGNLIQQRKKLPY
jgi:iron complex transport system substrate-binding protein